MNFPEYSRYLRLPEDRVHPLPPVSNEAKSLINHLLTDRGKRLSCRKYRDSDKARRKSRLHPPASDDMYFVFDDDAHDIKSHPFFRRTNWDQIHLRLPPFVPRIQQNEPITMYFEDEKAILKSMTETALTLNLDELVTPDMPPDILEKLHHVKSNPGDLFSQAREDVFQWFAEHNAVGLKAMTRDPKKRARDKILRDREAGKVALQIRKDFAFLGYTYRRPHYHVDLGKRRLSMSETAWRNESLAMAEAVGA